MPKLQHDEKPVMKNNVLPFPALQHAPKDPPRPSIWRALGVLVVIALAVALVAMTVYSLIE